jgi:hypothetical protein
MKPEMQSTLWQVEFSNPGATAALAKPAVETKLALGILCKLCETLPERPCCFFIALGDA